MVRLGTSLSVADNSGAVRAECIHVNGSTGKDVAHVGDTIKVTIKSCIPGSKVPKGSVQLAVVVRTKKLPPSLDTAMFVSFADNAVVLLSNSGELLGTRVIGSVSKAVRGVCSKIVSLASDVY